jgi:O-antigen/teichoic acid export membrane protein
MVLAKLCAAASVGVFALGLAVTAPILMFTNLQLRAVQATDARGDHSFSEYLGVRLAGTACALLVIAAVAWSTGDGRVAAVILVLGAAKAAESVSDLVYGLFQSREQLDLSAQSMLLRGPLALAVFGASLWLSRDVLAASLGLLGAFAAALLAWDLPRAARLLGGASALRPTLTRVRSLRLVRLALPLGVVMMLGSLTANVPRYFLEHEHGAAELGIFAALSSAIVAGTTVVTALGQSAAPLLARLFATGDHDGYLRLVLRLLAIGLLLGACGVALASVAGERILALLFTREYAARWHAFVALMVVAAIGYLASFLGYAVTATREFAAQMPLSAVVGATTLACSFWLVPRHGIYGAAFALGAGLAVQLAGGIFLCTRALAGARRVAES